MQVDRLLRVVGGGLCAALLVTASDRADAQEGADRLAARALFDEARALVAAGKTAEACPKFEESQRLDPGFGTLFNLADCYERTGRTASAWLSFLDVASQMRQSGQQDREKVARDRAAALEPKLMRLRISVPAQARAAGLEIKCDGRIIKEPSWGSALPLDPGDHTIEAAAAGRRPWKTTVRLDKPGETTATEVPALESATQGPAAAPVPAASTPPPASTATAPPVKEPEPAQAAVSPPSSGGTQKTLGLIIGGAGVVGFGVGTVLAFGAKSKFDDGMAYCNGDVCKQEGVDLRDKAYSQGTIATIVGGVGLAAIATGAVLYLTAPSGAPKQSSARNDNGWIVGPSFLSYRGTW